MSKITLGKGCSFDVEQLLVSRLLIQASSGGGKSHTIRALAEKADGKLQVIIIDPEGEFKTLREHYDYILAGVGGETPIDLRSAELLARRLLELGVSAVCDLYELPPSARKEWVKLFITSVMDAPRELWHPVLFIVDEAHMFAPEKGKGEATSLEAMLRLATAGQKRGYCAVFSTQRVAKLSKDAAAELHNKMIGKTSWPDDQDTARDLLGIRKKDAPNFDDSLRKMPRGSFYATGPALSDETVLVQVDDTVTKRPQSGSAKAGWVPPAPEKIKALLPKLADLPKAAEEKARTEADLRGEIRTLKATITNMQKQQDALPPNSIAFEEARNLAAKAVDVSLRKRDAEWEAVLKQAQKLIGDYRVFIADVISRMEKLNAFPMPPTAPAATFVELPKTAAVSNVPNLPSHTFVKATFKTNGGAPPAPSGDITAPQMRILRALAEFEAIGRVGIPRTWVAVRAGASHTSSSFGNNLSSLRVRGLIDYVPAGIQLTQEGRAAAPAVNAPTDSSEMLASCLNLLSNPQQRILQYVHQSYPAAIDRESLAAAAEASPTSSSFGNNLSSLRTAGMIDYTPDRKVKCAEWMFV